MLTHVADLPLFPTHALYQAAAHHAPMHALRLWAPQQTCLKTARCRCSSDPRRTSSCACYCPLRIDQIQYTESRGKKRRRQSNLGTARTHEKSKTTKLCKERGAPAELSSANSVRLQSVILGLTCPRPWASCPVPRLCPAASSQGGRCQALDRGHPCRQTAAAGWGRKERKNEGNSQE